MSKHAERPALLYKYFAPERAAQLCQGKLRFSQLSALNDPFEFLVNFDQAALAAAMRPLLENAWRETATPENLRKMTRDEVGKHAQLQSVLKNLPPRQRQQAEFLVSSRIGKYAEAEIAKYRGLTDVLANSLPGLFEKTTSELRDDQILIFCCAEVATCVPMWAHYASNHSGFQIGFDPDKMFDLKTKKGEAIVARKVSYVDSLPTIGGDLSSAPDFVTKKMTDWAYEREWRYLTVSKDAPQPAENEVFLFPFHREAVREVTFGVRADDDFVQSTMAILQESGFGSKFFRTLCPPGVYGLQRDPIPGL